METEEEPGLEIRVFCKATVRLRGHKTRMAQFVSLMSVKADNRTSKARHFQCWEPSL